MTYQDRVVKEIVIEVTGDDELDAIRFIIEAIKPLGDIAQNRVINYVQSKIQWQDLTHLQAQAPAKEQQS